MANYNRKIADCLYNLDDLYPAELKELSDNLEVYFDDYTDSQLSKIRSLFKLVLNDGFPALFKCHNIKISFEDGEVTFVNGYSQKCFDYDGKLDYTPILNEISAKDFLDKYKSAYSTHDKFDRWRSMTNLKDLSTWTNYAAEDGSVISIDDNDIKIICKAIGADAPSGRQLIKSAISNGGRKTESFSGQFRLFTKTGFTPISICKFDITKATSGWLKLNNVPNDIDLNSIDISKLRVPPEDIVFYIYTGNEEPIDFDTWVVEHEYCDSYDEAKIERDKILDKIMEGK